MAVMPPPPFPPPFSNPSSSPSSWTGRLGSKSFPIEPGRYHLYIGLFCPFVHRVLLALHLKGLQGFISLSVVRPYPKDNGGWRFPASDTEYPGSTIDHLYHSAFLHEIYFRSPPLYDEYAGKFSVPVLWDKKSRQIVNNESHEILRMLNTAFDHLLPEDSPQRELDLYPEVSRGEIDDVAAWLVPELNSGVYRAGFAADQESYERACRRVFRALDRLEKLFKAQGQAFLLGGDLTEIDILAYPTLIRFDAVYVQHFKLNMGTIRHDYPYLHRYVKHLYWHVKGFRETTEFRHIKENYTKSHTDINPKAITPLGPVPEVEMWNEIDQKWKEAWEAKSRQLDTYRLKSEQRYVHEEKKERKSCFG